MRRPRLFAGLLVAAASFAAPSSLTAASFYLATDVPTDLGGTTYAAHQIVRREAGHYALEASLPSGVSIGALHRLADGGWLLCPAHPATLGGATYEPRDVVRWDGASFWPWLRGSAAGIPEDARIDALFLDAGAAILSFDAPVNLGGAVYAASDLVRYDAGAFSSFRDAGAAGVPPGSNVVGADRDGAGTLVIAFDTPTTLSGIDYLPGQLAAWNGSSFTRYFADAAWPLSAQMRDFSFAQPSGTVPDGSSEPGEPLAITLAAGVLTLTWGPSCMTGDADYEIYEGILGSYYSHAAKLCTTGGATATSFAAPPGSVYYLVVPRNALREGSYGRRSDGARRPTGEGVCLEQEVGASCR